MLGSQKEWPWAVAAAGGGDGITFLPAIFSPGCLSVDGFASEVTDCLSVDGFASEVTDCLSVDGFASEVIDCLSVDGFASEVTDCLSVDELAIPPAGSSRVAPSRGIFQRGHMNSLLPQAS
jgi:hypothetical protein